MKKKLSFGSLILLLLIIFLFSWLLYVSKADPGYASYSKGFCTEVVSTYDLTNGIYDKGLIKVDEYAKLCDIVYRRTEEDDQVTFRNWKKISIPMRHFHLDTSNVKRPNLYFELWESTENTNETTVAIVFRGTEFKSLSDWGANLRWFIKGIDKYAWDHYDHLANISTTIVDSIRNRYDSTNVKIVSAGHSLGGGLAQFMAYAIPEINNVYAFDPSPVTGYYDVKPKSRRNQNKKDAVIYRIYESGEGLSFARKFMTILYPAPLFKTKDPALIRIRFSFKTAVNSANQHSIKGLAESLMLAKEGKE